MKRILSYTVALLLTVCLAACGSTSASESTEATSIETSSRPLEPETETKPTKTNATTVEETVLVDEGGIKITLKGMDTESFMGPELKLLIENNSGQDLTFQARNVSVNGYMVESMMSVDVVNGKKANDTLTLMSSDLKTCGISTIADIELSFHIFTTADWENYLDTPQIKIKTSGSDNFAYYFDDSGDVLYDGHGTKVVLKGLCEDDSILGPAICVYIENNSEKDITVQVRNVSINGFMVDAMFSSDVMIGKHAIDNITFLSSELEENGISKIENVEFSLHIFDTSSWETIIDTNIFSLTF